MQPIFKSQLLQVQYKWFWFQLEIAILFEIIQVVMEN